MRKTCEIVKISLEGLIQKSSGIVVMKNLRKLVVGDEESGLLLVLKAVSHKDL